MLRNRASEKVHVFIFKISGLHKLLVAQGISSGYLHAVEIIDIEDANNKCFNLDQSEYVLEGAHGGLNAKSEPWICGGLYRPNNNETYNVCWILKDGIWKRMSSLLHKRAYSGASLVAPGSYLFTGGAGTKWQSTSTVERNSNNGSRLLPDLGETLYQHCQVRFNQTLSFTEFYQKVKILAFKFII